MARYRWVIRTKESWGAGTDAGVFLGLTGDKQRMAETELDDPDSVNDWEAGDINHGLLETEELGNLVSGTLRHSGKGAGSEWAVDYVRVWNDEDGRSYFAQVNKTLKGQETLRLRFRKEADVRLDGMEESAEAPSKREPQPQPVFLSTRDDSAIVPAALSPPRHRSPDAEPAWLSRSPAAGDLTEEATLQRLRAEGLTDSQILQRLAQQQPSAEGTPYASAEGTPLWGESGEFGASFEPFRVMEPAPSSPEDSSAQSDEVSADSARTPGPASGTEEVWA